MNSFLFLGADHFCPDLDLKSEDLEERIRQLEDSIRSFEAIHITIEQSNLGDNFIERQLNQNSRVIESLVDTKKVLQDKLEKLLAFHASAPQLFANIAALEALVNQGASQTENAWTGNIFTIPKNLQWTTTVSEKWQLRQEKLRKQEQAYHEAKIKELKQYKVYAVIYTDAEGNPAILWQLEKDGKGVTNPELYKYLDKEGINLSPDLFELIDYNSWNEKIQNGWRNGYNYVTGETYNPALGSIITTSQYIQDGVTWLNETDIGTALQTLGFTYASYRMMTKNGPVMVENEQVSEADIPKGIGNPVKVEGRGNTGRIKPNNLNEQMAIHQIQSDPLKGAKELPLKMSDKRWPSEEGWVKMQNVVTLDDGTKVSVYFVYNKITGNFDDFKFK